MLLLIKNNVIFEQSFNYEIWFVDIFYSYIGNRSREPLAIKYLISHSISLVLSSNTLSSYFNLLTGSVVLLKLLFLKFTMTLSMRWIVVRSLHSFFSIYLLPLILSIIPSSSLVFKIGLVLMVFLLIVSHRISHLLPGSINQFSNYALFFSCGAPSRFRTWPAFFTLYRLQLVLAT